MSYTIKKSDFLSSLAEIFSGSYTHKNYEINKMKDNILDISFTPNTSDDKEALKDDFNTFLKDTQKAHNSLKNEFLYGKQSRRAGLSKSKNHQGHTVEEVFNDNLLPDATEIKKLSELDPDIIKWLKERAEKEQDFRHKTFTSRITLVSKTERGLRRVNYLGILCSFFLLGGGMYLS